MQRNPLLLIKSYLYIPFIDVVFPNICYICEVQLPADRKIICHNCWNTMQHIKERPEILLKNSPVDDYLILFEFEYKIQQLIHLLKYEHHLTLAEYLAEEAYHQFSTISPEKYQSIIPVPLYKTRKRERGYNQSEQIAMRLADITHIPMRTDYLSRNKHTSTQTKMTKQERKKNVRDAFSGNEHIKDRRILLIDDVVTTGSTVEACASVLKNCGVKKVDVLAIAHPSKHLSES